MTFRDKWEKLVNLACSLIIGIDYKGIEEFKMENATAKATTDSVISEREMYERDQRLSCLAHAVDVNRLTNEPDNIINKAKLFYDFVEKGK